jgi:hypothetical protein
MKKSKRLSRAYGAYICARRQQCCDNAFRLVWELGGKATYVEGCAIIRQDRIVCEHAWVECRGRTRDGTVTWRIIDPSPIWWKADAVYFPALRFVGREGLCDFEVYPAHLHSFPNSPEFAEARRLAENWIAQQQ